MEVVTGTLKNAWRITGSETSATLVVVVPDGGNRFLIAETSDAGLERLKRRAFEPMVFVVGEHSRCTSIVIPNDDNLTVN